VTGVPDRARHRRLLGATLAVALALTAERAWAQGAITLQWNTCAGASSPLNQDWSGPKVYRLVVSARGIQAPLTAYQVTLLLRGGASVDPNLCHAIYDGSLPPAWAFETGGCESQGVSVRYLSQHGAPCADLGLITPLTLTSYSTLTNLPTARRLQLVAAGSTPVAPDPAKAYLLAAIDFDMSFATVAGDSTAGACPGANDPACWLVESASFLDSSGSEINFAIANGFALWNDPTNSAMCPFAIDCLPAHSATWGQIKSRYR
jgi:hypothetical protein